MVAGECIEMVCCGRLDVAYWTVKSVSSSSGGSCFTRLVSLKACGDRGRFGFGDSTMLVMFTACSMHSQRDVDEQLPHPTGTSRVEGSISISVVCCASFAVLRRCDLLGGSDIASADPRD